MCPLPPSTPLWCSAWLLIEDVLIVGATHVASDDPRHVPQMISCPVKSAHSGADDPDLRWSSSLAGGLLLFTAIFRLRPCLCIIALAVFCCLE